MNLGTVAGRCTVYIVCQPVPPSSPHLHPRQHFPHQHDHSPYFSVISISFFLQHQQFLLSSNNHGCRKAQLHPLTSVSGQECGLHHVCMDFWLQAFWNANSLSCSTQKNPDDVVITLAIRTPLTKGFKGGFKDTDLDYLVYALLKKVAEESKLDPSTVEDISLGNVSKADTGLRIRRTYLR